MNAPEYRLVLEPSALVREHPPVFFHRHKAGLFELAQYGGGPASGGAHDLVVTRWPAEDGVESASCELLCRTAPTVVPGYYDYARVTRDDEAMEWHVNFADPELFCGYGGRLFAQDELQVAEHPLLACVREAILARGELARTRGAGRPAPVLVANVPRRLAIDTWPNPAAGRPHGIYGRRFASAEFEHIAAATTVLDPPTMSHIVAMAAPACGSGRYSRDDVRDALVTALTAFRAVRVESSATGGRAVLHTGSWGCGAFGGNRELMIALQMLAAWSAGIDRVVFHVGEPAQMGRAQAGIGRAEALAAQFDSARSIRDVIEHIVALGYEWGVSDGN